MWVHNLCLSISLRWWRTCLPEEPWVRQNPCGLFCTSLMTQYLEESQWERRRVPFYNAQWEREGKTDTDKEGGREGGRKKNTRGYYWSCACLLNPHRAEVLQSFPLRTFKLPDFTKNLRMPLSFFKSFQKLKRNVDSCSVRLFELKVDFTPGTRRIWTKKYYTQFK